jgi:hypothetical protein
MEKIPYWKAEQFSASEEFPCILWNAKIQDHIHKCPHLFLTLASSIQS